ncbi:hypothetical protein [Zhongshania sp.]|uniref:hypothetical protein n=1 Tax=Zhongshania sp. TaxID=1971902 RepID=UPI003568D231
MTECGVVPALAQVSITALVIPASEPVSMVVVVTWFSGLWMPDQVRHDGSVGSCRASRRYSVTPRHTGPRAGIHGCGRDVAQWSMDAGSSPA